MFGGLLRVLLSGDVGLPSDNLPFDGLPLVVHGSQTFHAETKSVWDYDRRSFGKDCEIGPFEQH